MATYVLVHGAWGGAHDFRTVRALLQARGHQVFTPGLTGLGERSHLASPQVGLSTHVADVVNAVWFEDLTAVVLLGFSYGGLVVTGAAGHISDRIAHLVFLDAFVGADGDTLAGLTGSGSGPGGDSAGGDSAAGGPAAGGGPLPGPAWLVPPPARDYDSPQQAQWAGRRRRPHPAACFTEPVHLARPLEDHPFTRTYIKATGEPRPPASAPLTAGSALWAAADRAASSPAWRYREIVTGHMVPVNRPAELAGLLLELA